MGSDHPRRTRGRWGQHRVLHHFLGGRIRVQLKFAVKESKGVKCRSARARHQARPPPVCVTRVQPPGPCTSASRTPAAQTAWGQPRGPGRDLHPGKGPVEGKSGHCTRDPRVAGVFVILLSILWCSSRAPAVLESQVLVGEGFFSPCLSWTFQSENKNSSRTRPLGQMCIRELPSLLSCPHPASFAHSPPFSLNFPFLRAAINSCLSILPCSCC